VGWFTHSLSAIVEMSLHLEEARESSIPHVLGYLPGSDFEHADELLLIVANYDGLGLEVNNTLYPAMNHNASGVGVMLEIARLWREQNLQPRRSVLFVAWGSGSLDYFGAQEFFSDPYKFRHLPTSNTRQFTEPAILVMLDYAGAGGEAVQVDPASAQRLIDLIEEASSELSIRVIREGTAMSQDVSVGFNSLSVQWVNVPVAPQDDVLGEIERDKLQDLGQILTLVLTRIVRESEY
jgi:hypothetical protein